jgi:hypothetical protein
MKKNVGIVFIVMYLLLQALYIRENMLTVLRLVISYMYLFFIPGYVLLSHVKFKEIIRIVLSLPVGFAVMGILVYYFNIIFHIPITPYYLIYPFVIILIASFPYIKKRTFSRKKA